MKNEGIQLFMGLRGEEEEEREYLTSSPKASTSKHRQLFKIQSNESIKLQSCKLFIML